MARYGRDHGGARGWFERWFGGGGGGGGGYDRGYRSSGGRGYDRSFSGGGRGGYDRSFFGDRVGNGRRYGADYNAGGGRGYFNPGYMVDEAWGGAFARGDAQFQGRRIYGDDYRAQGRPGYGGGYDRPYRGDAGYDQPGGFRRAFGRGYDRGR
jgi:hypothetical protein